MQGRLTPQRDLERRGGGVDYLGYRYLGTCRRAAGELPPDECITMTTTTAMAPCQFVFPSSVLQLDGQISATLEPKPPRLACRAAICGGRRVGLAKTRQ